MATTLVTDTAMQNTLKIIFDDVLVDNVTWDSELLSDFEFGGGIKQTTGGRYIETAPLFALNSGVGARVDDDYIPIPRGPTVQNSRIELAKIVGTVEMSADTMKRVRTVPGAFADWAQRALPGLRDRLTNELDRMMLGYGTGAKALVNAATPATNLVVDTAFGTAVAGTNATDALLQFLAGETLIASPNADGSSPRGAPDQMVVNDVDFANGYIVVDALATALANNDFLFAGDTSGNSADKEMMGLLGIVDDGTILATFQNITRATYTPWNAFVQDAQASPFATGQKLTEELLTYVDDEAFTRGGAKPDMIVTSRQGTRQYWADLKSDRVINDPVSFEGGKAGLMIHLGDRAVKLRVARKMPRTLCFGISTSSIRKYFLHNWEWNTTFNGGLWKQVSDGTGTKDAAYAYGTMYGELGCSHPHHNFLIKNITDAVS